MPNFAIVEAYIGAESISALRQSLVSVPEVKSRLEWFDELPTLTPEEIEADWRGFSQDHHPSADANDLPNRLALFKAHGRALGWFLNYMNMMEHSLDDDIPLPILNRFLDQKKKW
jgi:hypothetical protein